jgi:hypothetical protein
MGKPGIGARNAQKEVVMKSAIFAVTAAAALTVPLSAFAQSDTQAPVSRAQVRAELEQLEQAGYYPARGERVNYPKDIQAAEARVAAQKGATGYGGVKSGSSASGSPTTVSPSSPESQIYDY